MTINGEQSYFRPQVRQSMSLMPNTHLKVQMNYVVLMETGHAHQNLLGQSDDVFLCEGFVVIGNTLVKNFTSGSTERQKETI